MSDEPADDPASGPPSSRETGDDPDWATLARVAAGDADAFARLVERHERRILALCARFLGDREAARDAAQEVFLKTWRSAGGLEPRGRLSSWLYRIAVNHCLNQMRRRRLARFLSLSRPAPDEEPGEVALDPASPEAGPAERLAARERWRATRVAIDRLPAGQRAVLLLAKFEGLSYREIGAVLGLTQGAVESRLVRAMRRLAAAQETARPGVPEKGDGA